MASRTIFDLLGAYNALDFPGIRPDGLGDSAPSISAALRRIAAQNPANGILFLPPGTYICNSPIELVSGIGLEGFGTATVLQLGTDELDDVLKGEGVSNVRIRNLRVDGNRANNSAGTRYGIYLYQVTDGWLENVEAVSARSDGIRLEDCERVELVGCKASDNGRHGIALSYSRWCQLVSPRCYDNCQVAAAGAGNGVHLELLSSYNTIVAPVAYERALAGDRQGYGVVEAAGEGCFRNAVIGGICEGNRTADVSMESTDSQAFTRPQVHYLSASLTAY